MAEQRREQEHAVALRCRTEATADEDWQEFYEMLYPFVRGMAYSAAPSRMHEMEDMIQEAFTRIFQVMPEWDPERASIRTYLAPIVSNLLIDYLRHGSYAAARTVRIDDELQSFRIRAAQDPELLRRTAACLVDRLNDPVKIGIVRAILRDNEVKAICSAFNVKPNQVYAARIWLKKTLKEWSNFLPPS